MNRNLIFSVIALTSLLVAVNAPVIEVSRGQASATIYFETFDGLNVFDDFGGSLYDHWTVYRGTPQVVAAGDRDSVLRMIHPLPGGAPADFRDPATTALYLSNPATTNFADGMIEFDIYFENNRESGVSAMLIFRMQSDDTYYALQLTSTRDWRCHFMKNFGGGIWQIIGIESDQGAFSTRAWSHVMVTVGGPRFQCYKDGVLMCEAEDASWQKGAWGGIGFHNNYYSGVFYIDNFRIPEGFEWTTYRGSPGKASSMGRSAPSMFFEHPSQDGDGGPFADINAYSAYVSKPNTRRLTNGVIEFDLVFDNPGGQKAYVTFRMQSDTQYYALRLTSTNDWECYFLKQNDWGNSEIIGTQSAKGAIPLYVWTHIKIVVNGGTFECYRDGYLICSAFDQTWSHSTWGGIGFFTAYNRGAFHIDNLKICFSA